jgi:ATP-dependent Clp protease protease subunit
MNIFNFAARPVPASPPPKVPKPKKSKGATVPVPVVEEVPQAASTNQPQMMQLDIADLLGAPEEQPRLIFFTGEVSEEAIMAVIAQLTMLASKDPVEPIVLMISTYGGSVHEMFGLYDMMKYLPCPVHTVGIGKIMSAGVLLLASGEKGHRLIGEHSRVMVHPMMGGSYGNVFEIENQMKEMTDMQNTMEECLARESGKSVKEIRDLMSLRKDTYLTAREAIDFGLADGMIGYKTKIKLTE